MLLDDVELLEPEGAELLLLLRPDELEPSELLDDEPLAEELLGDEVDDELLDDEPLELLLTLLELDELLGVRDEDELEIGGSPLELLDDEELEDEEELLEELEDELLEELDEEDELEDIDMGSLLRPDKMRPRLIDEIGHVIRFVGPLSKRSFKNHKS